MGSSFLFSLFSMAPSLSLFLKGAAKGVHVCHFQSSPFWGAPLFPPLFMACVEVSSKCKRGLREHKEHYEYTCRYLSACLHLPILPPWATPNPMATPNWTDFSTQNIPQVLLVPMWMGNRSKWYLSECIWSNYSGGWVGAVGAMATVVGVADSLNPTKGCRMIEITKGDSVDMSIVCVCVFFF